VAPVNDTRSRRGRAVAAAGMVVAAAAICAMCVRHIEGPPAEQLVLERQVEKLRTLVASAESGSLLEFGQLLVVVDERLVQSLLASAVPFEGDVGGGFRVRIDSASASFADGVALIRLRGEATLVDRPISARADVYGGLEVVELHPESRVLRARAKVYAVDIQGADTLGIEQPARRLTRALAEGGLERLLGPIEVPVKVEDRLELPAVETRRIQIPAMDVPVAARVTSVRVFGGKLWVGIAAQLPGASGSPCQKRRGARS